MVVFGEIHGTKESKDYVIGALQGLSERGVKSVALELPVDAQAAFESRVRGENSPALAGGMIFAQNGARLGGPGIDSFVDIATRAKELGMSVHCVDAPRDPKEREVRNIQTLDNKFMRGRMTESQYVSGVQGQFTKRNEHMAQEISKLPGDTVLVTGMFHTGGRGSIEECLRKRGMDAVSVDVYPNSRNLTADIFERNESPRADLKVKEAGRGVNQSDIENMLTSLRGRGAGRAAAETELEPVDGFVLRRGSYALEQRGGREARVR